MKNGQQFIVGGAAPVIPHFSVCVSIRTPDDKFQQMRIPERCLLLSDNFIVSDFYDIICGKNQL